MLPGFLFCVGFVVGFFIQGWCHASKIHDQDVEIAYLKNMLMQKDKWRDERKSNWS